MLGFRATSCLIITINFALVSAQDPNLIIFNQHNAGITEVADYIIFQENENIELVCEADIPVEWVTEGQFSSYWTEPVVYRKTGSYQTTLKAKFTPSATGLITCEPLNKSPDLLTYSSSLYIYVNGTSSFAHKGTVTINLNKESHLIYKNSIPCRTTLPNTTASLVQLLNKDELLINSATFDPKIGFTLQSNVLVDETYKCISNQHSVIYRIVGQPFYVSPNKTTISSMTNAPIHLQCEGTSNLSLAISNESSAQFNVTTKLINFYPGGPTTVKYITITRVHTSVDLICKDESNSHGWSLHPPVVFEHLRNQSVRYFHQRNSFECRINSSSLYAKNIFCENMNNCALKAKCFQDESCPTIIKFAVPCSEPECVAVSYPFGTGVFECGNDEGSKYTYTYFTGLDRILYDANTEKSIPLDALVRIEEVTLPHYRGLSKPLLLFCSHTLFTLAKKAFFSIQFANGPVRELLRNEKLKLSGEELDLLEMKLLRDVHTVAVKIQPTLEVTGIVCSVPKINSLEFVNVTRKLEIIQAEAPEIHGWVTQRTIYTDENTPVVIMCNVTGNPPPIVSWDTRVTRNDVPFNGTLHQNTSISKSSILIFNQVNDSFSGVYSCVAENGMGRITKHLSIQVKQKILHSPFSLTWSVVICVTIIASTSLCIFLLLRRRQMQLNVYIQQLTEAEINEFIQGNIPKAQKHKTQEDALDFVNQLPYNNVYEIDSDALTFSFTDVLGQGAFGIVYSGLLNAKTPVAVKTMLKDANKKAFQDLLAEIKVMTHVGYHPCVVEFIGAVTDNIKNMEVYVVVELCQNGDLLSFLQSLQNPNLENDYINSGSPKQYKYEVESLQMKNLRQLTNWCLQICRGVEHLAKRKIIHGDIATRNILLDSKMSAKLADFGLSSRVSNYSEYVKGQAGPLPWRWVALESLQGYRFSYASDVWSVGVTLWEVFSFGLTPYPGMSWTLEFVQALSDGLRLTRPPMCPHKFYEKLTECWNPDPKERISLENLQNSLNEIVDDIKID